VRWVVVDVLSYWGAEERAKRISLFVRLLDMCWEKRNYLVALSVCLGLQDSSIERLKQTWSRVEPLCYERFGQLKELLHPGRNFTHFRQAISSAVSPAIPFLGIPFRDLIYLNDTNPTFVGPNKTSVNVLKLVEIYDLSYKWHNRLLKNSFNYEPNPQIASYVCAIFGFSRFPDSVAKKISFGLEPPKKKSPQILKEFATISFPIEEHVLLRSLLPHFFSSSLLPSESILMEGDGGGGEERWRRAEVRKTFMMKSPSLGKLKRNWTTKN